MGFSDDDGDLLEESKLLFLLYKLTLVLTLEKIHREIYRRV